MSRLFRTVRESLCGTGGSFFVPKSVLVQSIFVSRKTENLISESFGAVLRIKQMIILEDLVIVQQILHLIKVIGAVKVSLCIIAVVGSEDGELLVQAG